MSRRPPGGKVRVTYLEMKSPPREPAPPAPAGLTLRRVGSPDLARYRVLYRRVGDPWQWVARRVLGERELRAVFDEPGYELWLPEAEGEPIGFGELDRREAPAVEIRYFGLVEEWIGRGAGRWFLRAMIDRAWARTSPAPPPAPASALAWAGPGTERVWLHTCELDHPGALRFYQRGGFVPYGEGVEDWVDPEAVSLW